MRIVTRYIVREHVGPLIYALTALTSLLMLQYVARQLANLAGKGLPWSAIGKFFILSLPFTVAMTMPMAVLIATMYAFGRMASENEITAFKANGVRVRSLLAPVLAASLLLSVGMVIFNDQVLPRANHSLRILQSDIVRTKPALALQEQVMNTITESFVMRVARSNAGTGEIRDVSIYDLSQPFERKTIHADSGIISLAPNGRDLQLQLYDGHVQEFVKGNPLRLQRTFFREQSVRLRGISQSFELSGSDSYKSDREMSVCELHDRYMLAGAEYSRLLAEYLSFADKREVAEHVVRNPRGRPAQQKVATIYCGALAWFSRLFTPQVAHALPSGYVGDAPSLSEQPRTPLQSQAVGHIDSVHADSGHTDTGYVNSGYVDSGLTAQDDSTPKQPPTVLPVPIPGQLTDSAEIVGAFLSTTSQLVDARMTLDQVAVEIHKKFALSFACLIFVLFGPPVALRFPRGGVGVTLGVSSLVFGAYYVCLMAGETLADNGKLPPLLAMWTANIIFGVAGVALLWRIEQTTDRSRGGGLKDWWIDRKANKALFRAEKAKRSAAGAGSV